MRPLKSTWPTGYRSSHRLQPPALRATPLQLMLILFAPGQIEKPNRDRYGSRSERSAPLLLTGTL